MADEITLPQRLACLREAMAPLLEKLNVALAEKPLSTIPVGSVVDVIKGRPLAPADPSSPQSLVVHSDLDAVLRGFLPRGEHGHQS